MIQGFIDDVNQNKYFIGFMMIILTIGGRFIIGELSPSQKKLIDNKFLRRFFIFCSFFMATRDILKAIILTIIFVIIITEVLNDDDDEENEKDEVSSNKEKINEAINLLNDVRNDQNITNLM
jgi:putative Mn2+ efflux pump MntP